MSADLREKIKGLEEEIAEAIREVKYGDTGVYGAAGSIIKLVLDLIAREPAGESGPLATAGRQVGEDELLDAIKASSHQFWAVGSGGTTTWFQHYLVPELEKRGLRLALTRVAEGSPQPAGPPTWCANCQGINPESCAFPEWHEKPAVGGDTLTPEEAKRGSRDV